MRIDRFDQSALRHWLFGVDNGPSYISTVCHTRHCRLLLYLLKLSFRGHCFKMAARVTLSVGRQEHKLCTIWKQYVYDRTHTVNTTGEEARQGGTAFSDIGVV